ncbi:inositol monophosphatase family protein [Aestuariivirga sp.]|jgi:fructose-1,6-bisphosphatase/inositol monophosphatase family enzyme|uniref:inositol monophosphatase family protein n=1 Tax=Aestuariivirga sp. TaxID=2650926 RepID=UPI0037838375
MPFTRADLNHLAAILAEAAETEIMPRFRRLEDGGIREKTGALDLVTDADEQGEWRIRDLCAKAFPGALFVGEESVARDDTLLPKISGADRAIIVDPIDGTSNFAWGLPLFGVMAAVVEKGETVAGLILDPVGRDWHKGLRGEGAWAESVNGQTRDLRVAKPGPLSEMTGLSSWYLMPEPQRSRTAAKLAKTKACFNYRCAAYEYRLVAEGLVHFGLHYKLMPWDHAAGVLIHAEAGGYSALYDGTPYSPTRHEGGIISAPDRASYDLIRRELLG